jgi:hypothetical protein
MAMAILSAGGGFEFREMLGGADEPVPVGLNILRRAADLGHDLGDLFSRDHFDGVPRANFEVVGVRFFARDMDANFATDATFQIDFAEALQVVELIVLLHLEDAVDRADLEAGFAPGAVVGVDDRQFLGKLFTGTLFGHIEKRGIRGLITAWLSN